MSTEIKVGGLVLIAIAVLAYFVIKIEDLGSFSDTDAYPVNVRFDNAAGIAVDDPVLLAGVRVGRVASVRLNMQEGMAEVGLLLRRDVVLRDDASATVGSTGMLGDRILDIRPGTPGRPPLADGGWIRGGDPVSVDQLVNVISEIASNLEDTTRTISRVFGSEAGETSLREILANVEGITASVDELLTVNRGDIQSGVRQLDTAMTNLAALSDNIGDSLPDLVTEMRGVATDIRELVGGNREDLGEVGSNLRAATERLDRTAADLEALIAKMNRGDGTLSRLVNEPDTVDRLNEALDSVDDTLAAADTFFRRVGEARFSFQWRSEFYERVSATKNYFGIQMELGQEGSGRGFEFHIVDDKIGGITETNVTTQFIDPMTGRLLGTTVERRLIRQEGFRFNALISQRLKDFQIRGGIIESQAGFGVDFFTLGDRLRFTGEVWDLGRDPDPHVKLRFQYQVAGRFFITGGWDDAFRSGSRSYFLGGGYSFRR